MKPLLSRLGATALLAVVAVAAPVGATGIQAAAAQAAGGTTAPARVIGGPLAAVNVVQMSVAPLSDQSRGCGLESDLILDSFQQPLSEQGIVIQESAHVWIQLQATTLRYEGDICISYIEARAIQNTRYFDRKTESERSGRVLLWNEGGMFVTGASNHGVTTNIGWRDLARSFMRKWQMDQ